MISPEPLYASTALNNSLKHTLHAHNMRLDLPVGVHKNDSKTPSPTLYIQLMLTRIQLKTILLIMCSILWEAAVHSHTPLGADVGFQRRGVPIIIIGQLINGRGQTWLLCGVIGQEGRIGTAV